ncbi:MAG: hypothetical protein Q4G28_02490 [Neisseria sp.]|nr:hypothetical protein [Neisseria sp.]
MAKVETDLRVQSNLRENKKQGGKAIMMQRRMMDSSADLLKVAT